MAAPKRNRSKPDDAAQEKTRLAIKTTQLVKRLQCYALGMPDDAGNVVELDANRRMAIESLLRKVLPDLSQVDFKGEVRNTISRKPPTNDEWASQHNVETTGRPPARIN